jgi:hypothetical protein
MTLLMAVVRYATDGEPMDMGDRAGSVTNNQLTKGNAMTRKEAERQESITRLKEILKPGDKIYTILKHVSRSGMMRSIDVFKFDVDKDGHVVKHWLSYQIAKALDYPFDDRRESIKVSGCGMDMGFHIVYSLSATLFPNGFDCLGNHCPASDHSNRVKAKHHTQGGYALIQEWL